MKQKTVVKTYESPQDYEKDAKKMARKGYRVVSVNLGPERRRLGAVLVKGVFAKRRAETTVTYELA